MTVSNREVAIGKTLSYEGGYTNHPSDPGGPTNWGITIKDAQMYWRAGADAADVRAMPKSVAISIYVNKYWHKMGCDARPSGVDFVDFDLGVNSGTGRTDQFRKALAPLKLSPVDYVKRHSAKRLSFLQGLRTWGTFGKGWARRVADVEAFGLRLAIGATGQPIAPALKKEAAKASKKSVGSATAGATATAGAPVFPDVSGMQSTVALVVFGIAVAGVIGFLAWTAYKNHLRSEAMLREATA